LPQVKSVRKTSRGIVIKDNAVVLIERWRIDQHGQELHYFSIPGGKIESNETAEKAVVRELFEETSLLVRPTKLVAEQVFENGDTNFYYLCDYLSGSPKLHSSATEIQSKNNRSKPCWVTLAELENLNLNVYEPLRQLMLDVFKNKLPDNPLQIK